MIVGYLEDPEHLVEILGSGRKTKVSRKHLLKQTAFGVMDVHLASLGFPVCTGAIMQKKFDRYLASFKKAREWSLSTGAGLTEEEVTRGMTIEDKLNQRCPFYHKMYAIFGHRANIVPPATAEDGLPPEVEVEEDSSVPITFLDSQPIRLYIPASSKMFQNSKVAKSFMKIGMPFLETPSTLSQ
ncbi:hypothetical protein R1flu_027427 [Riccia fluitans]|uniref:Uncharacterized protein n=1 Tax=Riccia fluitans TaxID=41844 RepID=A0ABD1XIT4_9MARC